MIHNRPFDEIAIGDRASTQRTLTPQDVEFFARMAGDADLGPQQGASAAPAPGHGLIAHGMWGGVLISSVLGTRLPGLGTDYLDQSLHFVRPVSVGDTLTIEVTVTARDAADRRVTLACRGTNQHGDVVIEGQANVRAPAERIECPAATLPSLPGADDAMPALMALVRGLAPIRVAVAHPCDALSIGGPLDARAAGLIEPVLIGPRAKIQAAAQAAGIDLAGVEIEDAPHSHAAAARAAQMAGQGQVEAIMKGSLHTDELVSAILDANAGLRTKRRLTHCFLMHVAAYPRPFIITDAAVNIAPTLEEKADIIRNAIELAQAIGVERPRVAILAAVETVNPRMPATLDAAALCKMADRGQIAGAVLDGPLAFDNAVSAAAARIKGIDSPVAGQADVLVVPDLESGNMLAKQLEYLGGASTAGIVLGARVPVVLTSRADARDTRLASCAIAQLLAHRWRSQPR
ncbi:MAG: bifunctional enoyl-CoA hydratase/phosphate acetyltransferase [Burkholderiaceae bacterium]